MNNPIFTYNQEQAVKAGASNYITETGAYVGKISYAKWITSQSGAKGLELTFESDEGLKANYLTLWYKGKTGEPLQGGENMIQAIMGCTNTSELNATPHNQDLVATNLIDKPIGLMLQKELRLKSDGSETYSFKIICPFSAKSRKTLAEHVNNKPAERIDWLVEHTKDKDERAKQAPHLATNVEAMPPYATMQNDPYDQFPF